MERRIVFWLIVAFWTAMGLMNASAQSKQYESLALGAEAPLTDVSVKNVSGEELTLKQVAGENGLLVMFSCNTCPWVKAWEDRYNKVYRTAKAYGIGMVALNPNEDYRDNGDSFEDMKQRAKEQGYEFPYAVDRNHKLADALGATRTPEIFLFNSDMKLVYKGAIDDNAKSAKDVKNHYLLDALSQLASGKEIDPKATKSLGCTIKRTD